MDPEEAAARAYELGLSNGKSEAFAEAAGIVQRHIHSGEDAPAIKALHELEARAKGE